MRKIKGFTLAEVLITLGIIGILVATLIPTLASYGLSERYRSQYKKSLSTLNQAAKAALTNFDFDFGATYEVCNVENGASENPNHKCSFCALFNGALVSPYYLGLMSSIPNYTISANTAPNSGESDVFFDTDPSNYIGIGMADGSVVAFNKEAKGCSIPKGSVPTLAWAREHSECIGYIDLNGANGPNRIVNCDEINPREINLTTTCVVPKDIQHTTDIYPIFFYNGTISSATPAGTHIANTWKSTSTTDSH